MYYDMLSRSGPSDPILPLKSADAENPALDHGPIHSLEKLLQVTLTALGGQSVVGHVSVLPHRNAQDGDIAVVSHLLGWCRKLGVASVRVLSLGGEVTIGCAVIHAVHTAAVVRRSSVISVQQDQTTILVLDEPGPS